MRRKHRFAGRSAAASRGFSMVELLVGVGISVAVLTAVTAMYVTTSTIGRANARAGDIQTSGQQAMDAIRRDVMSAGFRGLTGDENQIIPVAVNPVTNDCAAGFTMNLRQAVWGTDDTNPFSATCIPAANYARGDVLAVRRLGIVPTGALAAGRLYLRSAYQAAEFFVGATPPAGFTHTPAFDYLADAAVYFIGPFTVSAGESPDVPALYRVRLISGPAVSAPELVASGIDDMQVQFEVRDSATGATVVQDAGAGALTDDSATSGYNGWDSVVAVRVFLLVRAQTAESGFAPGSRSYTLGSRTVTYEDAIPREIVASVISVRNR